MLSAPPPPVPVAAYHSEVRLCVRARRRMRPVRPNGEDRRSPWTDEGLDRGDRREGKEGREGGEGEARLQRRHRGVVQHQGGTCMRLPCSWLSSGKGDGSGALFGVVLLPLR